MKSDIQQRERDFGRYRQAAEKLKHEYWQAKLRAERERESLQMENVYLRRQLAELDLGVKPKPGAGAGKGNAKFNGDATSNSSEAELVNLNKLTGAPGVPEPSYLDIPPPPEDFMPDDPRWSDGAPPMPPDFYPGPPMPYYGRGPPRGYPMPPPGRPRRGKSRSGRTSPPSRSPSPDRRSVRSLDPRARSRGRYHYSSRSPSPSSRSQHHYSHRNKSRGRGPPSSPPAGYDYHSRDAYGLSPRNVPPPRPDGYVSPPSDNERPKRLAQSGVPPASLKGYRPPAKELISGEFFSHRVKV